MGDHATGGQILQVTIYEKEIGVLITNYLKTFSSMCVSSLKGKPAPR